MIALNVLALRLFGQITAVLCLLVFSGNASAFLEDSGARKDIKDLQEKTDQQSLQVKNQIQELISSIKSLENRLQGVELTIQSQALMDLLAQVERVSGQISFLKGDLEVIQHHLDQALQREKSLYEDIDSRLKKLEAAAASQQTQAAATPAPAANPEGASQAAETKQFNDAMTQLNEGQFKLAFESFNQFIQANPSSKLLPEAQYHLALSQFSLKNFKAAMLTQQKLISLYPESTRIADAKMMVANCQIQLSDIQSAKQTLRDLIAQHPDSELIPVAKKRLAVLNSLKK